MNKLIVRVFKPFIGTVAFAFFLALGTQKVSAQAATAQLTDKEIPVSEFNSLSVTDDFEVTLARGTYGVRLTVDKDLAPYVQVYVKSKTLYLDYDEKSVPKEIRKLYKGKHGLVPVFRIVAYTPEIQTVTLTDNAVLVGMEEFPSSQFELFATDKSQVKNLSVNAVSARISLKKHATAVISAKTERGMEVNMDNSSDLKLTGSGEELVIHSENSAVVVSNGPYKTQTLSTSGSSQVTVSSDADKVSITMEGSSKILLSGKANVLNVKGTRSSSADAYSMPVKEITVDLSGSSNVTASVSDQVDATLVGGSAFYFAGSPTFLIRKIVKSTLAPYGTK